jgi:hypothetical protein
MREALSSLSWELHYTAGEAGRGNYIMRKLEKGKRQI